MGILRCLRILRVLNALRVNDNNINLVLMEGKDANDLFFLVHLHYFGRVASYIYRKVTVAFEQRVQWIEL